MAIAYGAVLGSISTTGTATSRAFTTTASVPSGGKIIVSVGWYNNVTLSSVSGGSLTWTVDKTQTGVSDTNFRTGIASADAPAGLASSTTITANFSGTADQMCVSGYYATGLATGAPSIDATGGAGSSSNGTSATANVITTNADDFIAQSLAVDVLSTDITPATNMTEIYDIAHPDGAKFEVAYRIVASTGTYAVGGSWTGTKGWALAGVAYKALAAAGAAPDRPLIYPDAAVQRAANW